MNGRLAPPATLSEALLRTRQDADSVALIDDERHVTFAELRQRVDDRIAECDLPERSLVAIDGPNSVEWVVCYLALLQGGHVPLLAGRNVAELADAWSAQAVLQVAESGVSIERTRAECPDLHPDLALLVSTSGSTGSPKLVRLSHRNLTSNAQAIVDYLHLTDHDRGITSLPLHYCFGLSVLHSHLLAGASLVVTDGSVVDECFRRAMRDHAVTNLAGVPHTYDMIERVGAASFHLPSLRLMTQAGGKMAGQAVTRWVERVQGWGADFVVMYGQTEATARIAYLPPSLAATHPAAIGVPIPGGDLRVEHIAGFGDDVGELVYTGPNVMMGYAESAADLGRGHDIDELRTGDLARYHADVDVFEIVGRRSRFVKPFGLRIDLDRVQSRLRSSWPDAAVTGDDDRIVVFVGSEPTDIDVGARAALSEITGLPGLSIQVHDQAPPRTPSGKIDEVAMLAASFAETPIESDAVTSAAERPGVAGLFADVLGNAHVGPGDTFVSLGGDSLSYVECSIRLERALGHLPADWHLLAVRDLDAASRAPRRLARLDTTVLLRALGICMVVATHMRVWHIPGGAHTLLAVAGYNLARFMAPIASPVDRLRAGLRTAGRAAVPTMVWVAVGMLVFGSYSVGTLLLVNNYVGPSSHADDHWHFWFIEVFVHLVVIATLLLAIPAVARLDTRVRLLVPAALLAGALVLRMEWSHMDDWYNLRFRTHGIAWFFALGWLIQRTRSVPEKLAASLLVVVAVSGFFQIAAREWRIAGLLLLLVWVRTLPFPKRLVTPIGVLAAASMWIYVSHFTFWPLFRQIFVREVAYALTIATGVAVWFAAERLLGLLNTWRQGHRRFQITTPTMLRGLA